MEAPSYQVAYFGAGDRPRNSLTARLWLIAQLRAWLEVSAASVLHKDSGKTAVTKIQWQQIEELGRRLATMRQARGMGFAPIAQHLSGPGSEIAKSLDLAYLILAECQGDIEAAAERLALAIESKGGVTALWLAASSGGHLLAEEVFVENLQKRIMRPATVVLDIVEPSQDDEPALWLFQERMRHLLANHWQGYDLVFLARNDLALQNFPSLTDFDDIFNMALTLWIAGRGPNQVNLPELLTCLKQQGPVAGIWGVKVPVARPETARVRFFGLGVGRTQGQPMASMVRHQALTALERVKGEPVTSLTGLPTKGDGPSFYGMVLPGGKPALVEEIRKAWAGEGPLTIVSSPLLRDIYGVRVSAVDWAPLAAELGVSYGPPVSPNGHRRRFDSLGQALGAIEQRRQIKPGTIGSWKSTRGVEHENGV